MKTTVTLLILFTLLLPSTFAQDYMRWELPEGATTRLGKGSIREIQYAPDGRTLASGAREKTIRLWDPVTGELKRTLTGHKTSFQKGNSYTAYLRLTKAAMTFQVLP